MAPLMSSRGRSIALAFMCLGIGGLHTKVTSTSGDSSLEEPAPTLPDRTKSQGHVLRVSPLNTNKAIDKSIRVSLPTDWSNHCGFRGDSADDIRCEVDSAFSPASDDTSCELVGCMNALATNDDVRESLPISTASSGPEGSAVTSETGATKTRVEKRIDCLNTGRDERSAVTNDIGGDDSENYDEAVGVGKGSMGEASGEGTYRMTYGKGQECCNHSCGICAPKGQPCLQLVCGFIERQKGGSPKV